MLRILIVDDERIILNGIYKLIKEKLELGFATDIALASNVPQAIEMLELFHADLILTDIRMPVMDGFELIQYVRARGPKVHVAILSSHADFQYAQRAIRFHVEDFILKPIETNILKNTLERVYQQKQELENRLLYSAVQEIRNLMLYNLPAQELNCESEQFRKLFPHLYFTVVVLELPYIEPDYLELLTKILLQYYNSCDCFQLEDRNQLIAICNHGQFMAKPGNLEIEFMNASQCKNCRVGISISATSYKMLHNLYTNAVQRIFYAQHFSEDSKLTEISLFTYQDCVRVFLEQDTERTRELLSYYLNKAGAVSGGEYTAEMICRSFFSNIYLYLENNHIPVPEELNNYDCDINNNHELLSMLIDWLTDLKKRIQIVDDSKGDDLLAKQLLEYVNMHYREDISLNDLAEYVGFHPSYVSRTFKKNIGQSYLTCLHKKRLMVAKKLLLETDYTMEQIAVEVGYNSATQFSRVFRKYEDVVPSDYRLAHKS